MLTESSRIRDVWANPVGRDILKRALLSAGLGDGAIRNPLVGGIRLKALPKLTFGKLDTAFVGTLLEMMNGETGAPETVAPVSSADWWKDAVFYQIYPRSFKDSDGDGVGDLRGILGQLEYLQSLGVDALWLSPVYDSPNDDNGYDIRDYRKIMAEFGTMADFDALLEAVHARGMRLIMDLVVNHTSDEHEWFRRAVEEPDSKYSDYYFFRDKPNNWTSLFSGSAWRFIEERNQYALHLFSQKQMDLNWDNENVRREVQELVRWWLQKGVDGFRMDVINFISKRPGLPDGNAQIGAMSDFCGLEHYFYGPRLRDYLRELRKEAFDPFGAFSVGETPAIGMEMSKLLTADNRGALDMVFNFDQLETPGHSRFDDYRYDLNYYKKYITDWMEHYGPRCRMSLFFENHDNPRMISKVDPDPRFRTVLAKLLATLLLTLRGTPFLYQGQELGLVNGDFASIDALRDVESLNMYAELLKTKTPAEALAKVLAGTRDHARLPMPWTDGPYGGFSHDVSRSEPSTAPWLWTEGSRGDSAVAQAGDPDSVLSFYRTLISLRKAHRALTRGNIKIVNKKDKNLFTWWRTDQHESFYIECNLSSKATKRKNAPEGAVRALSNYIDGPTNRLRPYEAVVWKLMV